MSNGNFNTEIKTNIVNHLYVITNCPECDHQVAVSLGMVHRHEEGFCPNCLAPRTFYMSGENLDNFVTAFDALYERLQKSELTLALYNNPGVTMH